jgi:hypothetical protein
MPRERGRERETPGTELEPFASPCAPPLNLVVGGEKVAPAVDLPAGEEEVAPAMDLTAGGRGGRARRQRRGSRRSQCGPPPLLLLSSRLRGNEQRWGGGVVERGWERKVGEGGAAREEEGEGVVLREAGRKSYITSGRFFSYASIKKPPTNPYFADGSRQTFSRKKALGKKTHTPQLSAKAQFPVVNAITNQMKRFMFCIAYLFSGVAVVDRNKLNFVLND